VRRGLQTVSTSRLCRPLFCSNAWIPARSRQSERHNSGTLYHVDVASGDFTPIDLGGATLAEGNGLALEGQTLYVSTGQTVTVVQLTDGYLRGSVGESGSDPTFAAPAALARYDGCLLVVNSQIDRLEGQPVLPFTVSSVPVPPADGGTPAAAGRC
jgi:Cu-Zn family superoxide dismutase